MPSKPDSRSRQTGLTLIEAIISLTVLAVALLALWGTLIYCSRANSAAEQKKAAIYAAQAKLEELRMEDFDTLVSRYSPGGDVGNLFRAGNFDAGEDPGGRISFYLDESGEECEGMGFPLDLNGDGDTDDPDVIDLKLIPVKVTVTWNGPTGPQSIDFRTYLRGE